MSSVCDSATSDCGSATNDMAAIREILGKHGRLLVDVGTLDDSSDLYAAGLTSLATVGLLLALEDHFDVEFPESRLSRRTFASLTAIAQTVADLRG